MKFLKHDFILASQSPRRRRLLGDLKIPFKCISPEVEEVGKGFSPRDLVRENALRKWRWSCALYPAAYILTADTTVELDGRTLGKPRDRLDAARMLQDLSGREQLVHTGYVLARAVDGDPPSAVACGVETSRVTFKTLSPETIDAYITRVQPYDRAGAYDIDESGDLLVSRLDGSRTNVMGLPMERISSLLARIS